MPLVKYVCPRCKAPRRVILSDTLGFRPPRKCNLCFHLKDRDLPYSRRK